MIEVLKQHVQRVAALAVALCAFMAPPSAHAQRTGLDVDEVTVQGNVRQTAEMIRTEGGIRPGDTIQIRDMQRGVRKLWSTYAFKTIEPQLTETAQPNHVILNWLVEEQPYVGAIVFRGLESARASE